MTRTTLSKRWNIAPAQPRAAELAGQLKVSPLVAQVLLNRGIDTAESGAEFLRPNLKHLHDPSLIPNLDIASERIARSIRDGEKIVIYGDYDVDGITAVSILWHAIRTLGGNVHYYIPHRMEEGYGLNADAVAELCDGGAKLIVTVDCGVTAIEPAKVAKARGVDLIITDHHEWREVEKKDEVGRMKDESESGSSFILPPSAFNHVPVLPECHSIVHPRLPQAGMPPYPNPHLCGAGVAFKLAWGIGKAVVGASRVSDAYRAFLLDATAFAALGTIADVVPLVGENRVLAAFGLGGLQASKLVGIRALIDSAQLTGQTLDAYHVGFRLGPRLNACGRMGHAKLAVEMLTEASPARAMEIATFLENQNRERQTTERGILDQAIQQAMMLGCDREDCRAVVLGAEGWHQGVVGIVASRLVERFHRPTIMIALNNGHGHGSGRSINGFHIAKALDVCKEYLNTHGGHEMAAGLSLDTPKLVAFREAFCRHAAERLTLEQLVPEITLEITAQLNQLTTALVKDLQRLGPFGQGNKKPLICLPGVTVASPPRRVGKTAQHAQLVIRQGSNTIKCIVFNAGDDLDRLKPGTVIDVAGEAQLNEYNGYITVQIRLEDLRISETDASSARAS
jgi:single-stranded-DNA-specific exonuclease